MCKILRVEVKKKLKWFPHVCIPVIPFDFHFFPFIRLLNAHLFRRVTSCCISSSVLTLLSKINIYSEWQVGNGQRGPSALLEVA